MNPFATDPLFVNTILATRRTFLRLREVIPLYLKMTLEAIRYSNGQLDILDQLLLPLKSQYIEIKNVKDGWTAIKTMQVPVPLNLSKDEGLVRGAPAIAIVGALSLAVELHSSTLEESVKDKEGLKNFVNSNMEYLVSARPTAVNISKAAQEIYSLTSSLHQNQNVDFAEMKKKVINYLEVMFQNDILDNKSIGAHGANHIRENCVKKPLRILTHCNTGSLATASYGTALGVIRSLNESGDLDHVFCTETRPYNQGARLTAYELVHDKMPATLLCDSMVGWALQHKGVSAIVTGADRVTSNGDTANKIGTYQLAVLAKYHSIPFYIAAPFTTIDWSLSSGSDIPIEERPENEVTHFHGIRVAAEGIKCWNPSFDVTPASLITGGIITEKGVFAPQTLIEHKP